jgi:hypothetical protein
MSASDTVVFICPACGYKARLPEQLAGRTIKCPGCQVPQTVVAPVQPQRKTATFVKIGSTPIPFSLPREQADALAAIPPAVPVAPAPAKTFPSPLPGAIQITTDRIGRATPSGGAPTVGTRSHTARLAQPAGALIDFACTACQSRIRLPEHYSGKSILCPKCSAPQQVAQASTEPREITRSLSQKAAESPLVANPAPHQTAALVPDTGKRVRVTPLPKAYATPLPTAASTPTPAVAPLTIVGANPAATPDEPEAAPVASARPDTAAADGSLAELIDSEVATSPSQTFAKPHPSKAKSAARRSGTGPIANPAAPAVATPTKPVALTAGLLVTMIALAASWAYHLIAKGDSQVQLELAQAAAQAAHARELEVSEKLAELTAKLDALERKLNEPAPAPSPPAISAPAAAEANAPVPAPVIEAPAAMPEAAEPQAAPSPSTPADAANPSATTPAADTPPAP